jgi:hypothetical protein
VHHRNHAPLAVDAYRPARRGLVDAAVDPFSLRAGRWGREGVGGWKRGRGQAGGSSRLFPQALPTVSAPRMRILSIPLTPLRTARPAHEPDPHRLCGRSPFSLCSRPFRIVLTVCVFVPLSGYQRRHRPPKGLRCRHNSRLVDHRGAAGAHSGEHIENFSWPPICRHKLRTTASAWSYCTRQPLDHQLLFLLSRRLIDLRPCNTI